MHALSVHTTFILYGVAKSEQIDTFQSILVLYTTFPECQASHEFFAQSCYSRCCPGPYMGMHPKLCSRECSVAVYRVVLNFFQIYFLTEKPKTIFLLSAKNARYEFILSVPARINSRIQAMYETSYNLSYPISLYAWL